MSSQTYSNMLFDLKSNWLKSIDIFKVSPSLMVNRKIKSSEDDNKNTSMKRKYLDKMGSRYGGMLTILCCIISLSILTVLVNSMFEKKNDII